MPTAYRLKDFRSYADARLPLAPLTLLVGANASGKSNAIEGIRMLSWLARGLRVDDIFKDLAEQELRVRGRSDDLFRDGRSKLVLCAEFKVDSSVYQLELRLRRDAGGLRIDRETLTVDWSNLALYDVIDSAYGNSHDLRVMYNNFARGGVKPKVIASDQQAVFTQLGSPSSFAQHHKDARRWIPPAIAAVRRELESVLFLDPEPRRMRDYAFTADNRLATDGRNVSSALYDACAHGQRDRILDFIRALPEQDIEGIDFLVGPRHEVMVQLVETFGGHAVKREAPLLSDGTLRVLAIAAALLSAPTGSLVVIEEIDNGIHPSRAGLMLQNILTLARERDLRVLLTSHNPALADALPLVAVPDVVFCYRDPESGASDLRRLEDLPDYPDLVAQGPLGQLMTKGMIDRFAKDPRSPKERQQQALAWLDSLMPEEDAP